MFYITGDTHGSLDIEKLSNKNFPEGKKLTRDDYLIICGDFGLPFYDTDMCPPGSGLTDRQDRMHRNEYRYWIDWLALRKYTVLWLDGNHDNHPFWYSCRTERWNGGIINRHPDAENVIHLKRGEYYTIDGVTFWVMGGAYSHDKNYRTKGISWWEEEIPSADEQAYGLDTLRKHGMQADCILTHTLPQSLVPAAVGVNYSPEPTRIYLDRILSDVSYERWFCGHFHIDKELAAQRIRILYQDIVPLDLPDKKG